MKNSVNRVFSSNGISVEPGFAVCFFFLVLNLMVRLLSGFQWSAVLPDVQHLVGAALKLIIYIPDLEIPPHTFDMITDRVKMNGRTTVKRL